MKSWTDEELIEATQQGVSLAHVIKQLGLIPHGGNYKSIKQHIRRLGLDTSHFKGQGWSRGEKVYKHAAPLSEILIEYSTYGSDRLRKRLIKEGLKESRCEKCKSIDWMNLPIPLELDHINGNHNDNRIENLRILCPNCHAQTPTYRRKITPT